jgi:hypothetical protein
MDVDVPAAGDADAVLTEIPKYESGGCYAVLLDLAAKKPPKTVMITLVFSFIVPLCAQYFFLKELKDFTWSKDGDCPYKQDFSRGWNDPDPPCSFKNYKWMLGGEFYTYSYASEQEFKEAECSQGEKEDQADKPLDEIRCESWDAGVLLITRFMDKKMKWLVPVALFLFISNVLGSSISGSFMKQAMLVTTSPQITGSPGLKVFAFLLIAIDLWIVAFTFKIGVFVIGVFSGDAQNIVLNSLALGFITDLDEMLNKNIANIFPAEAKSKIDFTPPTEPISLYDSLRKGGCLGRMANALHVAVCYLMRFHLMPVLLLLPTLIFGLQLGEPYVDSYLIFKYSGYFLIALLFAGPLAVALPQLPKAGSLDADYAAGDFYVGGEELLQEDYTEEDYE